MSRRFWFAPLLMVAAVLAGCAPGGNPGTSSVGAEQATRAFNALYPGFLGSSAESSGTAWVVTGHSIPTADQSRPIPVRVQIQAGGTGVATAAVDGVPWSGTEILGSLMQRREASSGESSALGTVLEPFLNSPDSVVVGVGSESTDSVSVYSVTVSIETSVGPRPPLVFRWNAAGWDSGDDPWAIQVGHPTDVWQRQGAAFGLAIESMLFADTISPSEPKGSPRPADGHFVARILAIDGASGTVTIDRVQRMVDEQGAAATQDGQPYPQSGVYIRNRIHERTVLEVDGVSLTITRLDPDPWLPSFGSAVSRPIAAISWLDFVHEFETDKRFRDSLADTGALIVVSDGSVELVACY